MLFSPVAVHTKNDVLCILAEIVGDTLRWIKNTMDFHKRPIRQLTTTRSVYLNQHGNCACRLTVGTHY
jgi:hypothetical protein